METAKEILLVNLPDGCYWEEMNNLTNTPERFVLKAMEEYAIKKSIEVLNSLNDKMAQELFDGRPVPYITLDDCKEKWNGSAWSKVIQNQIKELENRLNQ